MNYQQPKQEKRRKFFFYRGTKKTLTHDQFAEIAAHAIPKTETWASARGEHYGAFNFPKEKVFVKKALYCVTPTKEVIKYFHDNEYDLLISHHPYIADAKTPQFITHTALDCCKGGLNDMWRDALGIKEPKHFDDNLGWYGKLETPMTFDKLKERVENFIGGKIDGGCYSDKPVIESVCVCSGLGGMVGYKAAKTGADCYIFGESTEEVRRYGFKAAIETGHTKSEWMGVNLYREIFKDYAITIDAAPLNLDYFGDEIYKKPTYGIGYYNPVSRVQTVSQGTAISKPVEKKDAIFEGRAYSPGQQPAVSSTFPAINQDPAWPVREDDDIPMSYYDRLTESEKLQLADMEEAEREKEDVEYDCGITIKLVNGKEVYYDDYNDLLVKDGMLCVKFFDVDRDCFRWHRYPVTQIERLEEDAWDE